MSTEVTTIGPECFTDGTVICYKGENYTRQPQQVTTVEELDALPVLSVVLDKHGESYQKILTDEGTTSPLWMAGDIVLSSLIDLPATVLHVGSTK